MKKQETKRIKFHIRTGDQILVIAGNEKGKKGRVVSVNAEKQRAVIEGLNLVTKHVKPSANRPEGGVVRIEAGIHISNLMNIDPKSGEPTRIGRRKNAETGKSERYSKKSGEVIYATKIEK